MVGAPHGEVLFLFIIIPEGVGNTSTNKSECNTIPKVSPRGIAPSNNALADWRHYSKYIFIGWSRLNGVIQSFYVWMVPSTYGFAICCTKTRT